MKKSKEMIRIALSAVVLLVGSYYIQKSVSTEDVLSEIVDGASAEIPVPPGDGGCGGCDGCGGK